MAILPVPFQRTLLHGIDVLELDLESLQSHLKRRDFTSEQLLQHTLSRINATNKYLECIIEVNPDALDIAKHSDHRRLNDGDSPRSILEGIPVLLKDNIATADQMETTAGSFALLGSRPKQDSTTAQFLREAGAVILGKANMQEWAGGRSDLSSAGYSARGGQCRNPYDLSKSPSGSSSGSAVAVAANIVPVSFGTETDTSIIWPAMKNGVVGIKPTVGVTSRAGVVPISHNQDTVGPFGRSVVDAVYALDAIQGPDGIDHATVGHDEKRPANGYRSYLGCKGDDLKAARFGLPIKRCFQVVREDHKKIALRLLEVLKHSGAEIIEVDFPSIEERTNAGGEWDWKHKFEAEPSKSEATVALTDFYDELAAYLLTTNDSSVKSLEDIIAYNKANTGTEGAAPGDHPAFMSGQDILEQAAKMGGKQDQVYKHALHWMQKQCRECGIDAALKGFSFSRRSVSADESLSALLLFDAKGVGQQYAAQAGYPIISIPIGLDDQGMPVALSLQHTSWMEGELIKWASAIEDVWTRVNGPLERPLYKQWKRKNIPIEEF